MSVPNKPPPGPGEDPTDITATDVMWGLIYTHDRANSNTEEIEDAQATLGALFELLVARGVLTEDEIEAARKVAGEQVRARFVRRGMAVVRQEFDVSKYAWPPSEPIDCAARVHLCKGACCRFLVALSTEDVKEGILRWETHQPYALAKTAEGSCVHMEEGTCRCRVYDARPVPCRAYDCRNDHRIWVDFEKRIPNPLIDDPDWPDNVETIVRAEDAQE
jgi:putative zinc- or iron-chelating protein